MESAPAIFPLFRSRITAAVLTKVYVGSGEYSVTELAMMAGTDRGTMAREISRLEAAEVVRSRSVGRTKLVSANQEAPFYRPLRDLVAIVLGPAEILGEELKELEGVEAASIFGSWAARAMGETGPAPQDIDLLVIGHLNRDDLHDAVMRARDRLGREVNPVVVAPERWEAGGDAFLKELRDRPMIALVGLANPGAS